MVQRRTSPALPDAESGSGSDWSDSDDYDFREFLVMNMKQVLQKRKGMTAAAAKEFIANRVRMKVKEACHDGNSIRTLEVTSEIRAASKTAGADVPAIRLKYEYHHRCRMSVEHHCKLTYSMAGSSGNFFKTSMVSLRGRGEVERRAFTFGQKKAKVLRDSVFGEGWSPLDAILMCYASTGVSFADKNAQLTTEADTPVCKRGWLEHHTKKVCKALDKDDAGYETEPYSQRYRAALEEIEDTYRDYDDDGYGREEYSDF